MPAVLVETGFISNADEERRLASPAYRETVASAVARAVRGYARADERVAAAR
jgi:N-acetylmuramoyl-L-alanine amidase